MEVVEAVEDGVDSSVEFDPSQVHAEALVRPGAEGEMGDGVAIEIAQDVALTGEILKLANSSFFGTTERVTSISRAISLVGADLIRFVVLGKKLFLRSDTTLYCVASS